MDKVRDLVSQKLKNLREEGEGGRGGERKVNARGREEEKREVKSIPSLLSGARPPRGWDCIGCNNYRRKGRGGSLERALGCSARLANCRSPFEE